MTINYKLNYLICVSLTNEMIELIKLNPRPWLFTLIFSGDIASKEAVKLIMEKLE